MSMENLASYLQTLENGTAGLTDEELNSGYRTQQMRADSFKRKNTPKQWTGTFGTGYYGGDEQYEKPMNSSPTGYGGYSSMFGGADMSSMIRALSGEYAQPAVIAAPDPRIPTGLAPTPTAGPGAMAAYQPMNMPGTNGIPNQGGMFGNFGEQQQQPLNLDIPDPIKSIEEFQKWRANNTPARAAREGEGGGGGMFGGMMGGGGSGGGGIGSMFSGIMGGQ